MEKNITLRPTTANYVQNAINQLRAHVVKPIERLSRYYASLVGRNFSVRQTLLLVNAQAAFFFVVFALGGSVLMRAAMVAWLVHALFLCRREL